MSNQIESPRLAIDNATALAPQTTRWRSAAGWCLGYFLILVGVPATYTTSFYWLLNVWESLYFKARDYALYHQTARYAMGRGIDRAVLRLSDPLTVGPAIVLAIVVPVLALLLLRRRFPRVIRGGAAALLTVVGATMVYSVIAGPRGFRFLLFLFAPVIPH